MLDKQISQAATNKEAGGEVISAMDAVSHAVIMMERARASKDKTKNRHKEAFSATIILPKPSAFTNRF